MPPFIFFPYTQRRLQRRIKRHTKATRPLKRHLGPWWWLLVLTIAVANYYQFTQSEMTGGVYVIDGDTLEMAEGTKVRLHGIDAFEMEQQCLQHGQSYPCGEQARAALHRMIADRPVRCQPVNNDKYGRTVVECVAGTTSLNEQMVREGWALAYRQHSGNYTAAESQAKATKSGAWAGSFESPWEWRKAN